jgi:hypothetical protein
MTRMMFDSDKIADLPRNALCATYSDLIPDLPTLNSLRSKFPHGLLLIDRHGDPTGKATILDVESGLHTASDAPGWYDRQKAKGLRYLTVYNDRSHLDAVNAAMGPSRIFYHWIARLDGYAFVEGFEPGKRPAAIQVFGQDRLGFHCDGSVVWSDDWNADPIVWTGAQAIVPALIRVAREIDEVRKIVQNHA